MKKLNSLVILLCILLVSVIPVYADSSNVFLDVLEDNSYYDAVLWGNETGIIKGDSSYFYPEKELTVGQMSVILCRLKNENIAANSWAEEQDICANTCVRDWVLPLTYLQELGSKVRFSSACYFLLKSEKIIFPETLDKNPSYSAVYHLENLGLLNTEDLNFDANITRGEFIDMIYKVSHYDFDSIDYRTYSNYQDVINQFGSHIVFEDDIDMKNSDVFKTMESYYSYLNNIPNEIREQFIEDGWTLYIGNETLSNYEDIYPFTIGGITDYSKKLISIRTVDSLYHEFGHYLQDKLDMIEKFSEYYEEGKDDIVKYHRLHLDNQQEYFAISFDLFVRSYYPKNINDTLNVEMFKEAAPKTWSYFESLGYFE